MDPQRLGLPFSTFRPGQENTIRAIARSKKPVFMLQAPVGSGKSAIALALQKVLGADAAVLTTDLGLLNQYRDDYGLAEMRGRRHFPCLVVPGVNADKGPCIAGERCIYKQGGCEYYDQRRHALKQPLYGTSYAMQVALTHVDDASDNLYRDLIICDEAHKLEQTLVSQASVEIRHSTVSKMGLSTLSPREQRSLESLRQWARANVETAEWAAKTAADSLKAEYGRLFQAIGAIAGMSDTRAENWVPTADQYSVTVKPLLVHEFFQEAFLDYADQILLMSGTLLNGEYQSKVLGIADGDWEWREEPMKFPKNRRPIHLVGNIKVSARRPESYDKVVELADRHIRRHQDEKGLIHTGNYALARHLQEKSEHRDSLIFYDPADRQQAIKRFRKRPPPAYLVGPSLTEGLDLPYRHVTQQLLLKLPIPNLQDPWVAARRELDDQWEGFQTASTVVQAYGRGMRSADDWSEFWILDSNIKWHMSKYRAYYPSWFRNAILWE